MQIDTNEPLFNILSLECPHISGGGEGSGGKSELASLCPAASWVDVFWQVIRMGSKVEYVDSSHMYATNYVRNSKAIGVLWGIFTICYAIILVVAFLTPEWMGDTSDSEYPGRFGLWKMCFYGGSTEECLGWLGDPSSVPGLFFKLASALAAFAILLAAATILAIPLFLFLPSTTLFKTSAWLQTVSGE